VLSARRLFLVRHCESTWIRTFAARRRRRFDAYMIYAESRARIVDYLGTHQHLAVDLEVSVDARGGMRIRSGEQRFYEGPVAFSFPLVLSGVAEVARDAGWLHAQGDTAGA
jgi:uncharacterized protein DUF4166